MKFLFVNLDWQHLVSAKTFKLHFKVPPLDLILLYNFTLASKNEGKIFDCFVEDIATLKNNIVWADWIIITTTPYHMWQCPNTEWNNITEALKLFPSEKVVLMGLHPSIFPEKTLRETNAVAVIRREPEVVFKEFLSTGNWHKCNGVSFLEADVYKENLPPKLPALDDLVVRQYDVDISKYSYFLLGKRTGVFESSRGCPWKCTFCDQEMYSWQYRTKSPRVFADEVATGIKQTGMETAYFYDLEFTLSDKRSVEMCEELIRAGVPKSLRWACQTRADMINEEMLDAMKAAGCVLIHFGVESANPQILKETNKKITLEKIEKGVRLAKQKGFQTACFFMFGLPGETPEQFDNTLEFARNLNPTYASFHFAIPFPGTPLYAQYLKEKNLPWGTWPATYFDAWPHQQIAKYLSTAYKKFYLTPKQLELRQFAYRLSNFGQKFSYFSSVT